jgi:membrane-bound lytic murein transglycosylase MltF
MRAEAVKLGLDQDKWFDNVEIVTARRIGMETTTYVRNIYKYYVAYKLTAEAHGAVRGAREELEPPKPPPAKKVAKSKPAAKTKAKPDL